MNTLKKPFLSKRYENGQVRIEVKLDKQRHTATISSTDYEQLCTQYALDHNPKNFLVGAKKAVVLQHQKAIEELEQQIEQLLNG